MLCVLCLCVVSVCLDLSSSYLLSSPGADAVRDELRFEYNVIIDDRAKSWWVDDGSNSGGRGGDRFGNQQRPKRAPRDMNFGPTGHDYTRAEDDHAELAEPERCARLGGCVWQTQYMCTHTSSLSLYIGLTRCTYIYIYIYICACV